MEQARPEPVFPVGFDEDALAEDIERLSKGAEEALEGFRKELRREGGLPESRLKACPKRLLGLRAFAFGVRHHPSAAESNAETVYEVADRRLGKKDS